MHILHPSFSFGELNSLIFYLSGVSLTIGVLSGTGTRLELARHGDVIAQDIQEALPIILDPPTVDRCAPEVKESSDESRACAVIFDKDGTLLCFHAFWTPWAEHFVEK